MPLNHNNFNPLSHPMYPPQQQYYNNIGMQPNQMNMHNSFNHNYDYDLGIGNGSSNLKLGENYIPLDMKDYNQPKSSEPPKVSAKDHFDFVNDLMKKKK